MSTFRVLHISNNLSKYPEAADDSAEFPTLVSWLHGEYAMFIFNTRTHDTYPAKEFFNAKNRYFSNDDHEQQLKDELQLTIEYIQAIKKQFMAYRDGDGTIHDAMLSMIRDCPCIVDNRVLVTDEQQTYLKLKRPGNENY